MNQINKNVLYHSNFLTARSVSHESQTHKLIWWGLAFIEILLSTRLILEYLVVSPTNTLTYGLYTITNYLVSPFSFVLTSASVQVSSAWILMVALSGYLLLTIALVSFLKAKRSPQLRVECARALSQRKYSR